MVNPVYIGVGYLLFDRTQAMKQYYLNRLKEPSTWFGIMQLAVAYSIWEVTPEQYDAIKTLVYLIIASGTGGVVIPDKQHD